MYGDFGMRLLEWDVDKDLLNDKMKWEPEFEIAFNHHSHPDSSLLYIDSTFFYSDTKDDYAILIKVRSVFSLSKVKDDIYKSGAVAAMLDYAISQVRGFCYVKCTESNLDIPVIPYFTQHRLADYASLAMYKPSVFALSFEQKGTGEILNVIANKKEIEINVLHCIINWFEPLQENHLENIISNNDENTASITFNFDYEKISNNEWKIFLHYGIIITSVARINVRTGFYIESSEQECFETNVLSLIAENAFNNMMKEFTKQCTQYKIEFDSEISLSKENYISYSEMIINQYGIRKIENENQTEMLKPGMNITVGGNTQLIMRGTFLILDEIMFLNPDFNREHNKGAIADIMLHEPMYYTLKWKCLEIEKGPVLLTWFQTIFLYLSLDIAIQLLISEHGDKLQTMFLKQNFTPFRQQEYLKFGTAFLENVNKSLKESGATIQNLQDRCDWASIIR